MARKVKPYDRDKSVKRIARERIGAVPASRTIEPKAKRKRPKHKQKLEDDPAS